MVKTKRKRKFKIKQKVVFPDAELDGIIVANVKYGSNRYEKLLKKYYKTYGIKFEETREFYPKAFFYVVKTRDGIQIAQEDEMWESKR